EGQHLPRYAKGDCADDRPFPGPATGMPSHEPKLCISATHEPELRLGQVMSPSYTSSQS
ncbi:hypothetical protein GW17_00021474, partial [Ensete ventricosum]